MLLPNRRSALTAAAPSPQTDGLRDSDIPCRLLDRLFPVAAAPAQRWTWPARVLAALVSAAAVVGAAMVLLLRIPGIPAWDTIYAEDYSEFLIGALQHPWPLFIQYNGYEQLLPRIVAQLAASLPLADAARVFAAAGALTAGVCALFVFYACAGHVRSVTLRILLAAAVILLSMAPMEIAGSTVDAPWYLLIALFWAMLWRPRTRSGMAAAALMAFAAAASTSIVIVLAPLLVARVVLLRRVRDHAVTVGWLAGCLVQLPLIVESAVSGQSRLVDGQDGGAGRSDRVGGSLSFYAHDVVLRTVGWHLSWWLVAHSTTDRATAIVAATLAVVLFLIAATQPGTRPFIVVALVTGFVITVVSVLLTPDAATSLVTRDSEPASRYTALPTFLTEAALIIGIDHVRRRAHDPHAGRKPGGQPAAIERALVSVVVLVAFLTANWTADFRYTGMRSAPFAHPWAAVVTGWQRECETSPTGEIRADVTNGFWGISCDRLRFYPPPIYRDDRGSLLSPSAR